MISDRFSVFLSRHSRIDRDVQVVRNYDGRVFAMSALEAHELSVEIERIARCADARRLRIESVSGDSEPRTGD